MHQLIWNRRVLGALAVVAGLTLLVVSFGSAQPPRESPKPPPRDGGREQPAKADPAVEAWVKLLAEKMTDRHDTIRESARQGLVAVGRPALPILRRLADSDDGAAAEAARKVIARIEHGPAVGFAIGPQPPGNPFVPGGPPPFGQGAGRPQPAPRAPPRPR